MTLQHFYPITSHAPYICETNTQQHFYPITTHAPYVCETNTQQHFHPITSHAPYVCETRLFLGLVVSAPLEDDTGEDGGDLGGVERGEHVVKDEFCDDEFVATDLTRHPPLQLNRPRRVHIAQLSQHLMADI